jgi:aspartate/methionine/tyrosine aminotransferase
VRFSSRLHWDLRPNPISKLLAEKKAAGVPILDLTESNPTNAGLDYPVDELVSAFSDPRILRYSPDAAGMWSAREAVSEHYYHGDVDPHRILLTTSTSEAYSFLFKLLTDPGDEVLAPRPSYPLFEFLAGMELVRIVQYPLVYHGRWEIDFAALDSCVTQRTRALVIVNPNNPTGSFIHSDELQTLVEFCARHDLAIISDEVFSDYAFGENPYRVASLRSVQRVPAFCLSGLSKTAGLPQMKLGWIVANDEAAFHRLELIADTYLSAGTPVQVAASRLLKAGEQVRTQIRYRTARNLELLQTRMNSVRHVEGGWYAVVQVPRLLTEEEWVLALLSEKNVLVQPGFFYDFASEAFLIVSLLTPPAMLEEGLSKILEKERSL